MKQFEKWNEETNVEPNAVFYLNRKEGWKAALECIRNEMLPSCYEPMDIYDFIEEELGDE